MILYLEAKIMVIKKLVIKQLHGVYNYTVKFNDDLTFIYGENGCGKTTILNIVSSIVTGKIYNLSSYNFEKIILYYSHKKTRKQERIEIISLNNSYVIYLSEINLKETIENIERISEMLSREDDEHSFERRFMHMYESSEFIKTNFNYIYLPLSRNSQNGIDVKDFRAFSRRRQPYYSEKDITNKNYLNDSLHYVEEIVKDGYMRINYSELSINNRFRSNIFTSSLKVTSEYSPKALSEAFKGKNNSISNIDKSKDEYIKLLKSIGEWNEDTEKSVEKFFKKYRETFQKSKKDPGVTVEFLLMNMELVRIKEIASQAQIIEREKEDVRLPITNFLEIVNNFFSVSADKKKISISNDGKIVVEADTPKRNLSLYNLSSGEKQIVIIFACLIFGLPINQNGIYIIDEPEASLHLAWQKIFVDAIQKVNNSIQFIFATHSPEIIGRYSSHAEKLNKTINKSKSKMGDELYE